MTRFWCINRVYCTQFPIAQQLSWKSSTKDSLFLHENRAQSTWFCFRENDHSELDFSSAKTELNTDFFLVLPFLFSPNAIPSPKNQPQKFANVHKVFGASNVIKLLNELHHTSVKTPSSMAASDSFPSSNTNSVNFKWKSVVPNLNSLNAVPSPKNP